MRKSVLDVSKTDEARTVAMLIELAEVLFKFKGDSNGDYVFINPKTGSYYRDTKSIVDTYYMPIAAYQLKLQVIMAKSLHITKK